MVDQRSRIAESVKAWRRVAEVGEALEAKELPQISTAHALAYLAPAFKYAASVSNPPSASGLLEQQRWFVRFRERHAFH